MLVLALAVCLVFTPILSGEAPLNRQGVSVGAKAAIVMEAETGAVLFAQNIREQLPMASTTKIMTALLALESPELEEPFVVENGDRIAQLVLLPVLTPELREAEQLSGTGRGSGGFGSTGVKQQ